MKTVRLKTSLLAILAVMGSVPGAGAQGQPKPQSVPSSAACYEAIVAPEVSEIRRIVVDAGKPDIRVEFQGASKVPFFSGGRCAGGAGGITCQAECDGGSVRMTVAGNELNLTTKRYALDAEIESALPFPMEADSGNLSGSFSLKRVDARVCAAAFNSRTSMGGELQRGDFSPRVRRIRKYLSDLGFLLQRPDWSFDAATENAMRAFQRSAGLTISGTADRDTVARLRLAAQLRGGC